MGSARISKKPRTTYLVNALHEAQEADISSTDDSDQTDSSNKQATPPYKNIVQCANYVIPKSSFGKKSSFNQPNHTLDWRSWQEVSSLLPWNLHQKRLPRWLKRHPFYHFTLNDSQSGREPIKTPTDEHNCVLEATQAKTNSSCTQRSVSDDPSDNANTTKRQKKTTK